MSIIKWREWKNFNGRKKSRKKYEQMDTYSFGKSKNLKNGILILSRSSCVIRHSAVKILREKEKGTVIRMKAPHRLVRSNLDMNEILLFNTLYRSRKHFPPMISWHISSDSRHLIYFYYNWKGICLLLLCSTLGEEI